jgi:hypothetical protein
MPLLKAWRRLSLLPGWIGLLVGAVLFPGARSEARLPNPVAEPALPDAAFTITGEVLLKAENGKIYLSEDGRTFEELQLTDSAAAMHLRRLVQQSPDAGSGVLWTSPTMVADGAGGEPWTRRANQGSSSGANAEKKSGGETQPADGASSNAQAQKQGG